MTVSILKRSLIALLGLALLAVQLGSGMASAAPSRPESNLAAGHGPPGRSSRAGQIYVVQRGDTLNAIARRFGVTVQAIMTANNLRSTAIFTGQSLWIPVPA